MKLNDIGAGTRAAQWHRRVDDEAHEGLSRFGRVHEHGEGPQHGPSAPAALAPGPQASPPETTPSANPFAGLPEPAAEHRLLMQPPVPAASPTASAQELAGIDLMLADPLNREIVAAYAPSAAPLPSTAAAAEMIRHYGAERAGRLQQLAQAGSAVRQEYLKGLDAAAVRPASPPDAPGPVPVGWGVDCEGQRGRFYSRFDVGRFSDWYAAQDGLASRAFAALYGPTTTATRMRGQEPISTTLIGQGLFTLNRGEPAQAGGPDGEGARGGGARVGSASSFSAEGPLAQVDLNAPPELHDASQVWFDPAMGFVTQRENLVVHQDWIDRAMPVIVSAAACWVSAGTAGALVNSVTQATGSSLLGAAAGAGFTGAVAATAGGMVSGHLTLKSVFTGALTGAITGGVMQATGLDTLGLNASGQVVSYAQRALAITGQATLQGALTQLAGGRFKDGFSNGLSAGVAAGLAAEVTGSMRADIDARVKAGSLNPVEASALRTMTQATGSAIRALASPNDPGFAMASDFISTLVGDGVLAVAGAVPSNGNASGERLAENSQSALAQGVGPWSEKDHRNGSDIESDAYSEAMRGANNRTALNTANMADDPDYHSPSREGLHADFRALEREYRQATDTGAVARNPATDNATASNLKPMSVLELAARKLEIERQVQRELLGQEAREDSVSGARLFLTGGAIRNAPRGGNGTFEMVRNNNWDAALNIGADPLGVLGELPGLMQDLHLLDHERAKAMVEETRQRMLNAGMKNVPEGYIGYIGTNVSGFDVQATMERLQVTYEGFVRDQRLRETWGDDYQNVRIGKSQMTVLEFEKRVLDIHMKATDCAYVAGIEAMAKGELSYKDGEYAKTLGNYTDDQVRRSLRDFARFEGINDSAASNLWAINRRIKNEYDIGIPDNRLGFNLYADTTLARKNAYTPQIMKWNDIRAGNFLIIRPTELGGAYVIPRASIPQQPKPLGRGI